MYYDNLQRLCGNALLHLYVTIGSSNRFTSSAVRNEILVKFLKGKVKDPEYKDLKKDLKLFVRVGRDKKMKLEKKLIEIRKITLMAINADDE